MTNRVLFMMLDGLRPDAVSAERTPNFWGLMQRGAYTLKGQSMNPSLTLPCHMSIFHSIPPERHGIIDNDYHSMARPVRGLVEQLKLYDYASAFFYNWEQLRDVSRPGSLAFSFFTDTAYTLDGDDIMAQQAVQHFQNSPTPFTFLYFGTIDSVGHAFGWMSEMYLAQAHRVDALLGDVLAILDKDTFVIAHADHGGHERTHGTTLPEDMTIPFVMAGKGIKQGYELTTPVSLLNTAPTVTHLLGIKPYTDWEGTPLTEALLS